MTAPPPPPGYPPYPPYPPYPQHPAQGGAPLPPPPFWGPVLLGAMVAFAMSALPSCAGPCCCLGANAWPGVFLAVFFRVRRDPMMRGVDGAIMGFMVGGLAGAVRAAVVLARLLPAAFTPQTVQEVVDEMTKSGNFTSLPADQQETLKDGLQQLGGMLGQYGDWMFAVALAVGGMVCGVLTWAIVRPRAWRMPLPPPPPPPPGPWPGTMPPPPPPPPPPR